MGHFMTALIATTSLVLTSQAGVSIEKPLSWSPAEMMTMKGITDVQISPDNKTLLFVATEAVMMEDKGVYISRIYKASTGGEGDAIPFSAEGISSVQPRWSPDGNWIAFVSARDGVRHLYLIRANGGEAVPLTKGKKDIQTFAWSPDSTKIAFVRTDETEKEKARKKTSDAYTYKEATAVNRLWIMDVFSENHTPRAMTSDEYCVRGLGDFGIINTEFDWSPDGKTIVFAYTPGLGFDYFYLDSSLASIDISSGSISPWKKTAVLEAMPRFSPSGEFVAYLSNDSSEKYAVNRRVALRSNDGKEPKLLASTYNEGVFLGGSHLLVWTKDGQNLLFCEPKGTRFHIALVPINGNDTTTLPMPDLFFHSPVLSEDKAVLGFVAQSPTTPSEVYVADLSSAEAKKVSDLNQSLLSFSAHRTEKISWQSIDALSIDGLLTYPSNYEEGKKYPLLLVIHGGPMGFFDETFLGTPYPYPLAPFADAGFMVFRPNPRGSCGYGKSFRIANYNDWGGMDFQDIMTGVDALIAKGIADPERMGVMGWSYGGYMTAWTVTQTDRFKAASMGAGLTNLISMSGTTDLHRFMFDYMGDMTDNQGLYLERSPVLYARNVTTPCLIQHGLEDKRVPVAQSHEFYHALLQEGKKPVLALYPGAGHRFVDPKMYLDAIELNLAWFQEHLSSP